MSEWVVGYIHRFERKRGELVILKHYKQKCSTFEKEKMFPGKLNLRKFIIAKLIT